MHAHVRVLDTQEAVNQTALLRGQSVLVRNGLRVELVGEIIERNGMNTPTHRFISRLSESEIAAHWALDRAHPLQR